MTHLPQELLLESAMFKLNCNLHRHSAIWEAETIQVIQQAEWAACVSQHVILSCIRDYMTGSAWSEPSVCAVCSCYNREVVPICLANDLTPYHLNLLQVPDDMMSWECAHFSYGNAVVDGIILAKEGLIFHNSSAVSMMVCKFCLSSLCKDWIPQLALANNLYRGSLPAEFKDLTWLEEKV